MRNFRGQIKAKNLAGELALSWNQIVPSLLKTYEKLKKLGYIIANGEVIIIEPEKEEKHG